MDPLLRVEHLARDGLLEIGNLELAAGECLAIRGPSGAGKSMLLRALVDLDPNEGRVYLDGRERRSMTAPAWRRRVAYVPAESGWWAPRVADHLADPAKAKALLAEMKLPAEALDWPVARLSTGERQRLALLRAMIAKPAVLLLDEPTSALDEAAETAVEALLHRLLEAGAGILLVTHDEAQAARLAGRAVRLEAGRLCGEAAS